LLAALYEPAASTASDGYRLTDVVLFQPDKRLTIEDGNADMGLTRDRHEAAAFEALP
jgi:hypothetical protein